IIRQLGTPDRLRGRMTSVNMIFFMGGPQLGEFEAGLVAQGFGAPGSLVTGGLGCPLAACGIPQKTPGLGAPGRAGPVVVEEPRVTEAREPAAGRPGGGR